MALNNLDVASVLAALSSQRPVFHSERDFQICLALALQKSWPKAKIRPEWRDSTNSGRQYIDIRFDLNGTSLFELKYKPNALTCTYEDEKFAVKRQGAIDHGCYDFWRDVVRLEGFVANGNISNGFVVLISNDGNYWRGPKGDSFYAQFKLQEGRNVDPTILSWHANTGGAKAGRDAPLRIRGSYSLTWHQYSSIGNTEFRYLLVEVGASIGLR